MNTDPIADMLSRIRNALAVNKTVVKLPYSNMKQRLAEELQRTGFIAEVNSEGEGINRELVLRLRDESEPSRINLIERVSKPGRRLYAKADDMPRVMNGRGIMIVSTSQGLMTNEAARRAGVGGELICKVY